MTWRRRWRRRIHPPYGRCRLLRCLDDNIGGDIFDVGGLLLDRLAIWSKGSVKLSDPKLAHENIRGERGRSPILTCLTCQKLEIMIGLGLGDALRFRGTTVPIRHRDGKARAPNPASPTEGIERRQAAEIPGAPH